MESVDLNPKQMECKLPALPTVAVVIVPLPAQGHLNQLLHLSFLLSSRSVPVHYVASATHIRQARERCHANNSPSTICNLHFHSISTPQFPTPRPSPSTNFPSHLIPAWEAAIDYLRSPIASFLSSLSTSVSRIAVIHDSLMSVAVSPLNGERIHNVEWYAFHSISAFASLFFQWEARGRPMEQWVSRLAVPLISSESCFPKEFLDFVNRQHNAAAPAVAGRIFNTCRAIEGDFIDRHAHHPLWHGQKLFAFGPLNPSTLSINSPAVSGYDNRHECLQWLDKQPPGSVVYVSFGTTSSLINEQIDELALGLELSQQRFIWVLRDPDLGDIYANENDDSLQQQQHHQQQQNQLVLLHRDYEKRVMGRGMIVKTWAPQLEILGHQSTGGFLSHCGWNSCVESMSNGVPILAWPMHSDQPRNTILIANVLKVGIVVKEWEKRDEIISAAVISDAIRRLMMVPGEGEQVRNNARTLSDVIRAAMEEGGSSSKELDNFITHIISGKLEDRQDKSVYG